MSLGASKIKKSEKCLIFGWVLCLNEQKAQNVDIYVVNFLQLQMHVSTQDNSHLNCSEHDIALSETSSNKENMDFLKGENSPFLPTGSVKVYFIKLHKKSFHL